jgi:hypothetical protein
MMWSYELLMVVLNPLQHPKLLIDMYFSEDIEYM